MPGRQYEQSIKSTNELLFNFQQGNRKIASKSSLSGSLWIHLLTSMKINSKGIVESTNAYQMSHPVECMVAEWPSQDSLAAENDHGWDFQSLYQIQIMLKVLWQCQGSKCKGGSN